MDIRECHEKDVKAVNDLMVELSEHADTGPPSLEETRKTLEYMSSLPDVYRNWIALDGDRVVAFISLVIYRTFLHPTGTALINELVVARKDRNRGIAGALVAHAGAFARKAGAVEIEVGTEFGNRKAQKFYRKSGFEKEFLLFNLGLRSG